MENIKKIGADELEKLIDKGINLLDFRPAEEFCEAFIPEALFIPDSWLTHRKMKQLLQPGQDIVIMGTDEAIRIAEKLKEIEAGKIIGYFEGGTEEWSKLKKPIDVVVSIEPFEMMVDMKFDEPHLVDTRFSKAAYNDEHLQNAEYFSPEELIERFAEIQDDNTVYLYCEDGESSLAIISFLKKHGMHHFYHIHGGFQEARSAGLPVESTKKAGRK